MVLQRTRRRLVPAALAAAAVWVVACSSPAKRISSLEASSAEWNAAVDRTILDAQRAARVKALGQELTQLQRSMAADEAALNEQAIALNARYGTTTEEAMTAARAFVERRRVAFAGYRDLVFAMRAEVSAAEWDEISK